MQSRMPGMTCAPGGSVTRLAFRNQRSCDISYMFWHQKMTLLAILLPCWTHSVTPTDFKALGRQIYGGHGWMTKLAKDSGKSFSAIQKMASGKVRIQPLMEAFLRAKADSLCNRE